MLLVWHTFFNQTEVQKRSKYITCESYERKFHRDIMAAETMDGPTSTSHLTPTVGVSDSHIWRPRSQSGNVRILTRLMTIISCKSNSADAFKTCMNNNCTGSVRYTPTSVCSCLFVFPKKPENWHASD